MSSDGSERIPGGPVSCPTSPTSPVLGPGKRMRWQGEEEVSLPEFFSPELAERRAWQW